MLTSGVIKQVLGEIPAGTTMTVKQIRAYVEANTSLSSEDWEAHTRTRKTKYPRWHHRVQAVLAEYKKKGCVIHNPEETSYTF